LSSQNPSQSLAKMLLQKIYNYKAAATYNTKRRDSTTNFVS